MAGSGRVKAYTRTPRVGGRVRPSEVLVEAAGPAHGVRCAAAALCGAVSSAKCLTTLLVRDGRDEGEQHEHGRWPARHLFQASPRRVGVGLLSPAHPCEHAASELRGQATTSADARSRWTEEPSAPAARAHSPDQGYTLITAVFSAPTSQCLAAVTLPRV